MSDDFLRLCVRRGSWTKRSRRRGVGQDGMPRIVAQRAGISMGFRVVSEQRIKMVVEALRSVIHNKDVTWKIYRGTPTLGCVEGQAGGEAGG